MPPPDECFEQAAIIRETELFRQLVEPKEARLLRVVTRAQRSAEGPREVGDHEAAPPRVVFVAKHVEQLQHLHRQPGLFDDFTLQCGGRSLVDLHIAGGKGPVALERRDSAANQQDLRTLDDGGDGTDRRVEPDDVGTTRARSAQAPLDLAIGERRAAACAEAFELVVPHVERLDREVDEQSLRTSAQSNYHPAAMKRVHLLGSTGSIGQTSERVLGELVATHRVVGLASGRGGPAFLAQVARMMPEAVAIADDDAAEMAARALRDQPVRVFGGNDSAARMVEAVPSEVVLNGITGARGLAASFAAVRRGADLALANKESMVMAGPLLARAATDHGARILPVDSEHSAIFQCLHRDSLASVRRILLTASGGPFRATPADELAHVTPQQALRHPTWSMGAKISIDSATLLNKALEVVEARWLFSLPAAQIAVVVHPQSIVHSMVEFCDGSILAQLGVPDMAVPIRFALAYPERSVTSDSYFDLARFQTLTFEEPDLARFPGLGLGFRAARAGGTAGAVLNAANEVAVAAFLEGGLSFQRIATTVAAVLDQVPHVAEPTLEQVLAADAAARAEAIACCCS